MSKLDPLWISDTDEQIFGSFRLDIRVFFHENSGGLKISEIKSLPLKTVSKILIWHTTTAQFENDDFIKNPDFVY